MVDGSPEPSSVELVRRLARDADYVIAADRGAEVLLEAGVEPDVFCGDADSASSEVAAWAHGSARTDIRFPSEKYATDLALAIDCARHEAARQGCRPELIVTCASGGRADHQLAVMGLLAKSADASPRIVEDAFECRLLAPTGEATWRVGAEGAVGMTLSAIPLAEGTVVSERGMRWNLDHKRLQLLDDLGISNVVMGEDAEVTCHEGVLATFLIRRALK